MSALVSSRGIRDGVLLPSPLPLTSLQTILLWPRRPLLQNQHFPLTAIPPSHFWSTGTEDVNEFAVIAQPGYATRLTW